MGRMGLPSISKLEDVLDLLLDPAKYQKYLVEFKEVYALTVAKLDDLETKEQAELYLAEATRTKTQTDAALAAAVKSLDEAKLAEEHAKSLLGYAEAYRDETVEKLDESKKAFSLEVDAFTDAKEQFSVYVKTEEARLAEESAASKARQIKTQEVLEEITEKRNKLVAALG